MRKNIIDKTRNFSYRSILTFLVAMMITISVGAVSTTHYETNRQYNNPPIFPLGDTIIVDDDGTGDYISIQTAINNANPGDYIVVKNGFYAEQITINVADISIAAASGEKPTLYLSSFDVGIDIVATDALIEGFEIYGNGSLTGGPFPTIRANTGSEGSTINNNEFKVFTGELGQIALLVETNVQSIIFSNNEVREYDTGIFLENGCKIKITMDNLISASHPLVHAVRIGNGDYYFGSIQTAINSAFVDEVINVLDGTFIENVVINKPLTLRGLQANFDPTAGRTGVESIIDGNAGHAITIADFITGVIIEGFTITISNKQSSAQGAGILIGKNTEDITIRNNIIKDITDGPGADTLADETYGIMVYGRDIAGGQSDITIDHNLIENVEEYGIAINDKTSEVTIQNNVIQNLIPSSHSDFPDPSWPSWVCAAIHLGGQVGPIENVTIFSNTLFTNVTGDGTISPAGGGISFAGVAEWTNPSRVWEGFNNVDIRNNKIFGNTAGIITLAGFFTTFPNVNFNNITNNAEYGVNNNLVTETINATNNWWGDLFGPFHPSYNPATTGDNVSNNVLYWPWYEFEDYSIPPTIETNVGLPQAQGGLYITDYTSIELKGSDGESGMRNLTYRLWNTTHRWSEWIEYDDDFSLSGDGKKIIEVNATDVAGTSAFLTETHYVDTMYPSAEVIYPNGGEYIRGSVDIQWTAADKILDQEQKYYNSNWALTDDYPGHIQSFVPTEESLNSIWLKMNGDESEITVVVFNNITPIPTPIAQTTAIFKDIGSAGNPEWVEFVFGTPVELEVDKTYYIGVTQDIIGNTGFSWYYYDSGTGSDIYPMGQAYLKRTDSLESHPEWDWSFRTTYWDQDVLVDIQYSPNAGADWINVAFDLTNDGSYIWDTTQLPDAVNYKVRVVVSDVMDYMGDDSSDEVFTIDNTGPSITDITITDTTISSTEYTKDGDDIEIVATITGNPATIYADLRGFGKGEEVAPTAYDGTTAVWQITSVNCFPVDGPVQITIEAEDLTGDIGGNTAEITADNTAPSLDITRPLLGVYIFDGQRLLPYPYPLVFGQITITTDTSDSGSGINKVEIYKIYHGESTLIGMLDEVPYDFLWDERAFGFYQIEIVAYDNVGLTSTDKINDIFIINLDIKD